MYACILTTTYDGKDYNQVYKICDTEAKAKMSCKDTFNYLSKVLHESYKTHLHPVFMYWFWTFYYTVKNSNYYIKNLLVDVTGLSASFYLSTYKDGHGNKYTYRYEVSFKLHYMLYEDVPKSYVFHVSPKTKTWRK